MAWYLYPSIIAAGFAAGFINTLAGSGSLITLPLLIFIGLPATIANGTNRIAICLQNVVAVKSFHRHGLLDTRKALLLAVPAVAGAVLGARIAVGLDEQLMRRAIGVVMCGMLAVLFIRPARWIEERPGPAAGRPGILQALSLFAIGLYGGFVQAGVGILLLTILVIGAGCDIVKGNAIKVLIVLCFTVCALGVFILHGQVEWKVGLVLASGNMMGAWTAARTAARRGAGFVRWVLIAVVLFSAFALLGGWDLAARLLF